MDLSILFNEILLVGPIRNTNVYYDFQFSLMRFIDTKISDSPCKGLSFQFSLMRFLNVLYVEYLIAILLSILFNEIHEVEIDTDTQRIVLSILFNEIPLLLQH